MREGWEGLRAKVWVWERLQRDPLCAHGQAAPGAEPERRGLCERFVKALPPRELMREGRGGHQARGIPGNVLGRRWLPFEPWGSSELVLGEGQGTRLSCGLLAQHTPPHPLPAPSIEEGGSEHF